jgi:hypothetical protein
MGHIVIFLIILIFICYFVFNIYEKFQTITDIENICYYDDIQDLYYRKGDDNKIIVVNDYLEYCNGVQNLELNGEDLFKIYGKKP